MAAIVSEFVLYWLEYSFQYGKIYFGRANVTTIPNLSKSRLSELLFPIPPPEQRKIAYILNRVQQAIEKQEQLIRTTTELKKALMQKLFTEGLHGEPQKETEIGLVPESWEVVEFDDICKRVGENYIPEKSDKMYVGLEHIRSGTTTLSDWGNEKDVKSSKTKFKQGEILYGKLRPYLDKAVLAPFNGICSTDILVFTCKANITNEFLGFIFHTDRFLKYAISTTSGVQHPRTSWSAIKNLKVGLPQKGEQSEITRILFLIEGKIELHQKKKQTLTSLFKTLLHQLMTGQLRVHEIDFENELSEGVLSIAAEKEAVYGNV